MGEEEQVVKDRLQKLIDKMNEVGYEEHWIRLTKGWVNELQQRGVYCVDRLIGKLWDRVDAKEEYLDILMEGRIALILAKSDFSKIHVECSDDEPDLKANYSGHTIYFEVTRRRPSEEDERCLKANEAYWVSLDRTENIMGKIRDKLRQLKSGEVNVVVLCSETIKLGLPDAEEADKYIQKEIDSDPEIYKNLSGVIFTESVEVPATPLGQFKLFRNEKASKPIEDILARKLESLHE